MFTQVTIIGFGLIGSSLARSMKQKNLAQTIICADQAQEVCDYVLKNNLADKATTDIASSVQDSDLVILSIPVGVLVDTCRQISPSLKAGAIVTDTGSIKSSIAQDMQAALGKDVLCVPAHPIAGTEYSGPEAGFIELFEGRWCIITPLPNVDVQAVEKVTALWEACGSTIEIMEPGRHDLILAITSHLPHLIAYTIVGTATELEEDIKGEVIKFSASGFRDFTRIASSDPTMWRDIFLSNKDAVLEILQRFTEDLTAIQRAIRKSDGEYLYRTFETTRDIRKAIIEAGQAE